MTVQRILSILTVGVAGTAAASVLALAPPLPCDGVNEANMSIGTTEPLGGWESSSGFVIDGYYNVQVVVDNVYTGLPGPVPELNDFTGFRVVECATGAFIAVDGPGVNDARIALPATEFLRADLQNGQRPTMDNVVRAVRALYGDAIRMRETAETCGCNAFFPDLRPASQIPFTERTDLN